ncbi:EF-hand calcium-binding domain-containing protein 14 [Erpetoichthys calabaricus]|uniref:EF-hand calcium-binding domain-containing protein 14 n=1 Tax=Erpetoichthys calabaricus TaxID=27687 RepID=UPI00109FD3F1|nr:EF-hand calcium-binding domain-containing protein 14 [Erpetoichthys calabaricus]
MKKRKELNALIGLGGESKRKKPKKGSGHRLLRTEPPDSDSDTSSDEDDFNSLGGRTLLGTRGYVQCCRICYPLCAFIILAACTVACAGLIWMQIALKEDLDAMKEKLRAMESSQKVSAQEIPKLSEDLLEKQKRLENIEAGDKGLNTIWSNITEINKQISLLDSAVSHLKTNIKSASDLISLPVTVEELQKSVATIGSTLTSVQHDVGTMQATLDEHKKAMDLLKKNVEIIDLHEAVNDLNSSLVVFHTQSGHQIHNMNESISNLTQRVIILEGDIHEINFSKESKKKFNDEGRQVTDLKEKLQMMDALSTQSESEDMEHKENVDKEEHKPANKTINEENHSSLGTGDVNSRHLAFPGINSMKDLTNLFQTVDLDSSGSISYENLKNHFGTSIPEMEELQHFDVDGNEQYSLSELKAALGL